MVEFEDGGGAHIRDEDLAPRMCLAFHFIFLFFFADRGGWGWSTQILSENGCS
jgi:hypothetical protein